MPVPQPPRVVGPLSRKPGANSGSGGNNRGKGNPSNPAPNITGQPNSPCLISNPLSGVPLVGSVGGGCLISKTAVRALVGGLLIGMGGTLLIVGGVVLAASGFRRAGGVEKVAGAIGAVPLPQTQAAAAGIRAAGRPRQGPPRRQARAQAEAKWMAGVGEPRENTSLREGRGAIRETSRERARRMAGASSNGGRDRAPF